MTLSRFKPHILLVIAVFLVYLPALGGGFIWDDAAHIADKAVLTFPDGLRQIWLVPGATQQYYPLTHSIFWLAFVAWGKNTLGYHLLNVLLHALSSILLMTFLDRLRVRGSLWIALIFALHPLNVESVAWISELKNVLSMFFFLTALNAYFRALEDRAPRWPALAWTAYVAALCSKTTTCTWPVVVLAICWWQRRPLKAHFVRLLPAFALGAIAGLATVYFEQAHIGAAGADWTLSWAQHLVLAGKIICFYIGKTLLPLGLAFVYPRWSLTPLQVIDWIPLLTVVFAVAWLIWERNKYRGALVCVAIYIVNLLPALGFFNVYPMRYSFVADHFQYFALPALLVLIVSALSHLLSHSSLAAYQRLPRLRTPAAALIALGLLSWDRTRVFQSNESLWRDALVKNPKSAILQNNLGIELYARGKTAEAEQAFRSANEASPGISEPYSNLGRISRDRGDNQAAFEWYRKAAAENPNDPGLQAELGLLQLNNHRPAEALPYFQNSVHLLEQLLQVRSAGEKPAIKRQLANAYDNLAVTYYSLKQLSEAEQAIRTAVQLDPQSKIHQDHLKHVLSKRRAVSVQ
jgi:protein O-mannosyl-transferase